MIDIHSYLSALAVFSELYDNRKDIFNVLWEFVKHAIYKNQKWMFQADEVKQLLIQEYNFDEVPLAVINTLLRKKFVKNYIQGDEKGYNVTPRFKAEMKETSYDDEMKEQKQRFSVLLNKLREYIEKSNTGQSYRDDTLLKALKSYLLENHQGELVDVISSFVIENQDNKDIIDNLNQIREGCVLYEGIIWCDNLNELENWNQPLTLFFDMDIIFYLAGYSGEIYQKITDEMYQMIQQMNVNYSKRHKGKRCISIKYFPEVREQIDTYFGYAEDIVEGKRILDISQPAMRYITSSCETPSQVRIMRQNLNVMLDNKGILEETQTFYNDSQFHYNIEDMSLIEKYEKMEKRSKIEKHLRNINYICMLREKQPCKTFKTCRYLLITRNRFCMLMDNDRESYITKQYNRVMSPETLTSMLWFLLNKGFATTKLPDSLDVLVQAKTIMAHQMNRNVSEAYINLMKEFDQGKYNSTEVAMAIAGLRQYSLLPEDVTTQSIAETCALSETQVQDIVKRYEKQHAQELAQREHYEQIKAEKIILQQQVLQERQKAQQEIAAAQEKDAIISEQDTQLSQQSEEIQKLSALVLQHQEVEALRAKRKQQFRFGLKVMLTAFFFLVGLVLFILDYKFFSILATAAGALDVFLVWFVKPLLDKKKG